VTATLPDSWESKELVCHIEFRCFLDYREVTVQHGNLITWQEHHCHFMMNKDVRVMVDTYLALLVEKLVHNDNIK